MSREPRTRGRVTLVGAGPGAPDLITLRGAAAVRDADVILYDELASEELLRLASSGALTINVGRRGHDAPTRNQEEVNALIVEHARAGRAVVRLKGGDPFVFGRGGEEASACVEAGLAFEVVPGVSSALAAAAYAGIPVTDRRHSASFAVVTGHKDPTRVSEETRWAALGTAVDTLVILMGMRNLEELVSRIVAGGKDPETPAAVVMEGTLPNQRVVEAPLSQLVERVRRAGLGAPAAVVVGDVVKLRKTLAWWEHQPLFGMRVLVTRSEEQAGDMLAALRERGAEPVPIPMIHLVEPQDATPLDRALGRIEDYDAILFTSQNAVRFFSDRALDLGVDLAAVGAQVVCVGPRTAELASERGLPVHLVPSKRFDAESMLAEIVAQVPPRGRRFLLPQSEVARAVLADGLRAAGGEVERVTVYRNLPPDVNAEGLRADLIAGRLDALTFTSPSTARNFVAMLDTEAREAAKRCVVAAIGRVTAETLEHADLPAQVVARESGGRQLVESLAAHVVSQRSPHWPGASSEPSDGESTERPTEGAT
ncbi:MAG: uroporphyrinogen-III C-methyltransferase [Proteobacteria bacterium]|nr:uroporphyrinogen-III C-methyltransferase [Pseudomonadota bacterium]